MLSKQGLRLRSWSHVWPHLFLIFQMIRYACRLSNQKLHIFLLYINYLVLVIIYRDKKGLRKAECPFIISVEHIWLKSLYLREKNICSKALFSSFFFFVRLFLDRHAAFARDLERKRTCDNSLFSSNHGLFFFFIYFSSHPQTKPSLNTIFFLHDTSIAYSQVILHFCKMLW